MFVSATFIYQYKEVIDADVDGDYQGLGMRLEECVSKIELGCMDYWWQQPDIMFDTAVLARNRLGYEGIDFGFLSYYEFVVML